MRTIIAGSRGITDYNALLIAISKASFPITEIISGNARGVDAMGERYALDLGISCRQFPADWKTHGRRAGYLRNEEMAQHAQALIALWDGRSPGTRHMIEIAEKHRLIVHVHITNATSA